MRDLVEDAALLFVVVILGAGAVIAVGLAYHTIVWGF